MGIAKNEFPQSGKKTREKWTWGKFPSGPTLTNKECNFGRNKTTRKKKGGGGGRRTKVRLKKTPNMECQTMGSQKKKPKTQKTQQENPQKSRAKGTAKYAEGTRRRKKTKGQVRTHTKKKGTGWAARGERKKAG